MDELDLHALRDALATLGELLEFETESRFEIGVCGGSAMLVSGAVDRRTEDVDVVAIVVHEKATYAEPLPSALTSIATRVARDLGLSPIWLNAGPADMLTWGLPEGWLGRATVWKFGALTVHFFSREDLIPPKLHAVVDQGAGKHLDDLRALEPTIDEMVGAAKWCLQQDSSPGFQMVLRDVLTQLGFGDALDRL